MENTGLVHGTGKDSCCRFELHKNGYSEWFQYFAFTTKAALNILVQRSLPRDVYNASVEFSKCETAESKH